MKELTAIYDDALSPDLCQRLIDIFDKHSEHHQQYNRATTSFTQINLSLLASTYPEEHDLLLQTGQHHLARYRQKRHVAFLPRHFDFEHFRLKRYQNNRMDQFKEHVDVVDYSSARRFLGFFWYLNDVDLGGETIFPLLNRLAVKPKTGRLLVFPPLWMFPHIGAPPLSNPKYIVGSYLHYK